MADGKSVAMIPAAMGIDRVTVGGEPGLLFRFQMPPSSKIEQVSLVLPMSTDDLRKIVAQADKEKVTEIEAWLANYEKKGPTQ